MDMLYHNEVSIPTDSIRLKGELSIPAGAKGIIIFSHGSGSSRLSPRNRQTANFLQQNGFGTLLFDLLTPDEEQDYRNRFAIDLLKERLIDATSWLEHLSAAQMLPVAYFGASTGAASALKAAAKLPQIYAVVSRGGRPDLAMPELSEVKAPTLLIVGSLDKEVLKLNQQAYNELRCTKQLEVVEGATHLFEEPGKMDEVAILATKWFWQYIPVPLPG